MRCLEFGCGLLQDVIQSLSLGEDRQYTCLDIENEKTHRFSSTHQSITLAEGTVDGNDADRLVQETFNKAGSLDFADAERQNGSLVISLIDE